ncbi:MAG: glutamate synthase subunit beta [Thiovulaceae bacterium]|nr:glutamate synthase subunit beta [Sulfurimonadaceae bacterium]
MQNFIFTDRIEPAKRLVGERVRDFKEIYDLFTAAEASTQAERCIQCGDPFCLNKCPLHNYIPQWLKSVAEKDLSFAFKLSNEPSPFPEVMGRICPHDVLCEGDCTLNDGHGAITIGSIETQINEEGFKQGLKPAFPGVTSNKKVSVIGSGPAGLSAATYLLRAGIAVDMYEKADRPGGLLTYGIPNFKLDKKIVERRVDLLKEAGLNLHLNVEIGTDKSFEDIANSSDAVFLGLGATKAKKAGLPNENAQGVVEAMSLLNDVQNRLFGNKYNDELCVKEKRILVIGGGDTAMDCLRSSIREGARSVTCAYRRDAANMPGSKKEYKNSVEEGADFEFNASPKAIVIDDKGKVIGAEFVKTRLTTPDESGRQSVEEIKGSEFTIDADMVIMALGFNPAVPKFLAENGIQTNSWGGIELKDNFETSTAGIFSGGDCYRGADLVVRAAYDGREAAKSMIQQLIG